MDELAAATMRTVHLHV